VRLRQGSLPRGEGRRLGSDRADSPTEERGKPPHDAAGRRDPARRHPRRAVPLERPGVEGQERRPIEERLHLRCRLSSADRGADDEALRGHERVPDCAEIVRDRTGAGVQARKAPAAVADLVVGEVNPVHPGPGLQAPLYDHLRRAALFPSRCGLPFSVTRRTSRLLRLRRRQGRETRMQPHQGTPSPGLSSVASVKYVPRGGRRPSSSSGRRVVPG